jgi:hypothetical protein
MRSEVRTKTLVYTGRRGAIDRMGHHFDRGVPKVVPYEIAMKLVVHYSREFEVVWEGKVEDTLAIVGNRPEFDRIESLDTVYMSEEVVEEIIEEIVTRKSKRGRPPKAEE